MLQEVIELGHRTTGWSVDYSSDGENWAPVPEATGKQSIGFSLFLKDLHYNPIAEFKAFKRLVDRLKALIVPHVTQIIYSLSLGLKKESFLRW